MTGKLTNYALDKYVAPKMSELNKCDIPDMSNHSRESDHWIYNFILNSIFRVSVDARLKQYTLFFLRRTQTAFREYQIARVVLYEYLKGEKDRIPVYIESLFHFETCIAQMWQAIDQTMKYQSRVDNGSQKIYEKGDKSSYERLNKLYNISRYAGDNILEDGTVPVWLTNKGLEAKDASITFRELALVLGKIGNIADVLSNPSVS